MYAGGKNTERLCGKCTEIKANIIRMYTQENMQMLDGRYRHHRQECRPEEYGGNRRKFQAVQFSRHKECGNNTRTVGEKNTGIKDVNVDGKKTEIIRRKCRRKCHGSTRYPQPPDIPHLTGGPVPWEGGIFIFIFIVHNITPAPHFSPFAACIFEAVLAPQGKFLTPICNNLH